MDEMILRSLKGETTAVEERQLADWRAAAGTNERHYQQLVRLAEAARLLEPGLRAAPVPDPQRLLSEFDGRIIAQRRRAPLRGWWTPWGLAVGAAAAIAALALGMSELRDALDAGGPREIELVTGNDETITATLGDAGAVRLGPDTRLRVTRAGGQSEAWLEGRAYFSIAKQPGRSFRVRTQAGDAVVLGTRFDVEARQTDLRVVVVEGRVRVAARGTQVEVGPSEIGMVVEGAAPTVEPVEDVHALLSWMDHFIAFERTPLREVARELELSFGIRVEIRGEKLAERQVTGWSSGRSIDEILGAICRTIAARCSFIDGVAVFEP